MHSRDRDVRGIGGSFAGILPDARMPAVNSATSGVREGRNLHRASSVHLALSKPRDSTNA